MPPTFQPPRPLLSNPKPCSAPSASTCSDPPTLLSPPPSSIPSPLLNLTPAVSLVCSTPMRPFYQAPS